MRGHEKGCMCKRIETGYEGVETGIKGSKKFFRKPCPLTSQERDGTERQMREINSYMDA